jgi:hypothetical protein
VGGTACHCSLQSLSSRRQARQGLIAVVEGARGAERGVRQVGRRADTSTDTAAHAGGGKSRFIFPYLPLSIRRWLAGPAILPLRPTITSAPLQQRHGRKRRVSLVWRSSGISLTSHSTSSLAL